MSISLGNGVPHLRFQGASTWSDAGQHSLLTASHRIKAVRQHMHVSMVSTNAEVCPAPSGCMPLRLWLDLLCPCGGLPWASGAVDVVACPASCIITETMAPLNAFMLALPGRPPNTASCLSEPRSSAFEGWGTTFGSRWQCGTSGSSTHATRAHRGRLARSYSYS